MVSILKQNTFLEGSYLCIDELPRILIVCKLILLPMEYDDRISEIVHVFINITYRFKDRFCHIDTQEREHHSIFKYRMQIFRFLC